MESRGGRPETGRGARRGAVAAAALACLWTLAAAQASYGADLAAEPDALPADEATDTARPRGWVLRRALLAADAAGSGVALAIAQTAFTRFSAHDLVLDAAFLLGLAFWTLLAQAHGLYSSDEVRVVRSTADDLPGVVLLVTLATWVAVLFLAVAHLARPHLRGVGAFWVAAIVLVLLARSLARTVVRRFWTLRERTVIVGAGRVGAEIARKLARRPEYGLDVIGFVDDDPLVAPEDGPPHLGGTARIEAVLRAFDARRVIFAFSRLGTAEQVDVFRRCLELGVQVDVVPRMFEVMGSRTEVHDLDGLPLVALRAPRLSRSSRLLKRALDLALASAALVALGPFLLYAAARIRLESQGPVFFRQERMGAGGRRFEILKLRTMDADADARKHEVAHLNKHAEQGPRMFKVPDDPRVTRFGRFLRRWSLDELPQLFNVLRGEMSLVGPRPLILAEDEQILGAGRSRLRLTPGVTGLWQVLGRSDIPFAEMITLDYLYVTNWSLWGDVKLLARTVPVVLRKRGAY